MTSLERHEAGILVLAPLGRDAPVLCELLTRAGLPTRPCKGPADLHEQLRGGAGAVLLSQDGIGRASLAALEAALGVQPAWSELPVVVLVDDGWRSLPALVSFAQGSNVTVLQRPTRSATLVSVLRSALRARERQYQVRELLARLEDTNDELERRVQERSQELLRSNQQLTAKVEAHASALEALVEARAQTEAEHLRVTTILESISDAFMAFDQGYRFTYLNPRAATMFQELSGSRTETFVGESVWRLLPGLPINIFRKHFEQAMTERTPVHFEEYHDRLGIWLEVHAYPTEAGLAVYCRDITVRKRSEEEFLGAVQEVMSDAAWFSQSLLEKLAQVRVRKAGGAQQQGHLADLSPRERQVLERIAGGQDNETIAAELKLGEQTVRNYVSNIYAKLDVHSRSEAVIWARERGLAGR